MKIRIVCEKRGWILHRMAEEIAGRLPDVRINRRLPDADIHYFINYGYYRRRPARGLAVACFTHYDPAHLADRFEAAAREVDHCVAISEQTAEALRSLGVADEKISVIIIGADEAFRPALTLGVVGRVYPGGRKGERLVAELLADPEIMDGLRIVSPDKGWGAELWRLPTRGDFYRAIDYLLVPALIEGGPVPFMEALACGTLSIAPPVGVVPRFPHIEYETGHIPALKSLIQRLKAEHRARLAPAADAMRQYTWAQWASEHEALFRRLLGRPR